MTACLGCGRRPGVARRASNFLSRRRKKVTKERATLLRASLRCATGNLRCSHRGCAAELTARYALRSNNCGKSVHEVRVSFGTRRREPQNGHPHGPLLRCAALGPVSRAQAPRAAQARPSAAMARMDVGCSTVPPLLAAPAAGRLWGGTRVGAPMLRELTRRGCLNEAAPQRSEFHGAPRNRPDAGLPRSEAQGSQTGGRLFFGN